MRKVISKDGTSIAFDKTGEGPAIILVNGAIQHRAFDPGTAKLAALLSKQFTVFNYDRRGRGDSGDSLPFAVEREIEDIEALIKAAGGSAFVYGMSSGAALAMHAAIKLGDMVKKLALYEAPYNSDDTAQKAWKEYTTQLKHLLKANLRGDAAALFLKLVGMPADQIEGMRLTPVWPTFEAVAPTLAYDAAALGEYAAVPIEAAARVSVPTLVMDGGAGLAFMHITAAALAKAIPGAVHKTLEGQTHDVAPEALAPILEEFFAA